MSTDRGKMVDETRVGQRYRLDEMGGTVLGETIGHTAGLARMDFGKVVGQTQSLDRRDHIDYEGSPLYCGVVLAGGTGSRMGALTKVTNKHLLPVGHEPMIYHPLRKLAGANVEETMIVTGTEHMGDFVNLLGSGGEHDATYTYRVQDRPGGIAQALALAERFCGTDHVVVLLGDNVFESPLGPILDACKPGRAMVVLKRVPDPGRYGVAVLAGRDIVDIEEKPAEPKGDLAVTGIYVYPPDVWDVIRTLKPSGRGELEITDVNRYYLAAGRLDYVVLQGYWTDAGTLPSWAEANKLVMDRPPQF